MGKRKKRSRAAIMAKRAAEEENRQKRLAAQFVLDCEHMPCEEAVASFDADELVVGKAAAPCERCGVEVLWAGDGRWLLPGRHTMVLQQMANGRVA